MERGLAGFLPTPLFSAMLFFQQLEDGGCHLLRRGAAGEVLAQFVRRELDLFPLVGLFFRHDGVKRFGSFTS